VARPLTWTPLAPITSVTRSTLLVCTRLAPGTAPLTALA
jgi:hypothetical protein